MKTPMKIGLLAGIGLMLSTLALTGAPLAAAQAGDSGPRLRLPVIEITPHPAPNATDYSTCLMHCATREDTCRARARSPAAARECRLQRSLCDPDCLRYGINER
ncbi:MAG: hypothetical protein RLT05_15440 [Bauldia litoralis]